MTAMKSAIMQLEELIDQTLDASEWLTLTQDMIDKFADATLDNYWIHVDPARATAESQFGTTIAHGLLVLGLTSHFREQCFPDFSDNAMGMVYGFDKLRFLSPVPVNSRLRGVFTIKEVLKKMDNEIFTASQFIIEIEGEETPALRGELLGYFAFDTE